MPIIHRLKARHRVVENTLRNPRNSRRVPPTLCAACGADRAGARQLIQRRGVRVGSVDAEPWVVYHRARIPSAQCGAMYEALRPRAAIAVSRIRARSCCGRPAIATSPRPGRVPDHGMPPTSLRRAPVSNATRKYARGNSGSFSIACQNAINSSVVKVRSRGISTLRFDTPTTGLTATSSRSMA